MRGDFARQRLANGVSRTLSLMALVLALVAAAAAWAEGGGNEWKALNDEAPKLRRAGKHDSAVAVATRALEIARKNAAPEHPDLAASLLTLSDLHAIQGRYALAAPLLKEALPLMEMALAPDHPEVAKIANNLAWLYDTLGQYELAESLYKRALAIREKAFGPDHPVVATSLGNLGLFYRDQGKHAEAEPLLKRSLAITEDSFGSDHPDVATGLNALAVLYHTQGRYAEAEALYKRSLPIIEKFHGRDHPEVAVGLDNIAQLHGNQGQDQLAEPLFKRALAIREKVLGPEHPDVASSLDNLAELYSHAGEHATAEALYKRALAILERNLGPDNPRIARSLASLALLYSRQGDHKQAEPLYVRSLAIQEKALGADHSDVARTLNNLAGLYKDQGEHARAEPLYRRSLAIWEKTLGPDHPDVATSLGNLAALYYFQKKDAQAEPLYRRTLAIQEAAFGPDHPKLAASLNNLAALHYARGRYSAALPLIRRVTAIYRHRIVAGGTSDSSIREATVARGAFFNHLSLLSRNPDKEALAHIADEAFQLVQLGQATGTGSAVAKMAARFAKGDDAIAGLVKRKQDAIDRRLKLESNLVVAASQPPGKRNAAGEQRQRDEIARLARDIDAVDAQLNARFPEYQELTRPEPLRLSQVQALLRPNEAMMVYAITADQSWLWVVRSGGADFLPLKADQKTLADTVGRIRAQMDVESSGVLAKVDVARLNDLYQSIFAPAVKHLAGVQHVIVVPAGPLQSLPFGLLVASAPGAIRSDADYRAVDWLVKRYALSVLPSAGSLRALRQFAKPGVASEPFIGFGDPLLTDQSETTRSARAKTDLAGLFRNLAVSAAESPNAEIADVQLIRQQARLPETADELRAMARIVKAGSNSIWLQDAATETNVKRLDLSKYRTIAFATHGVMAGEVGKGMEPGLLLTPPAQGSLQDDGYLAAGEIARLKLNADWVLLSACNTAASDGSPGAEGLSGLAKAFFYAGSRSLLVSHWPVVSDATVPLTTTLLREYEAHPAQGKAEAHRKAMLALMNAPGHPEYAHPLYWAPFVVVGEGW